MNSFRHIRWLHLSDFHTGKDGYGERMLFKSILTHVAKNAPPDFIFISGDIAQAGLKAQYEKFGEEFLLPLKEKTGDDCTILLVPGNHDVDRSKQEFVTREVVRQKSIQFFDPDENGLSKRQAILPRFAAYRESYIPLVDNKGDWLASRGGCFIHISTSKGVGILGLNTAWFAENEHDERELTPGKLILETGLEQIKNSEIKIVLGHHPLDWFQREEAEAIRALFGHHQVIYLHGHMHKNRSRFEEGAGYPFLTLQSGAAFQAREDEQWINGLLWAELDRTKQRLALKPLLWNKNNQEWALDGAAFPERCRLPDTDRWILPLPGSQAAPLSDPPKSKPTADKPAKFFKPPPGWEIVNQEYLDKIDKNPDEAVILSYFDGRIPNWGLALCPDIPRRTAVKEITDRLVVAPEEKRPSINMLLGAGGEGKSTAFLQIIE
ncbi:MAG: hypothetical protein GY862_05605, partial [Gammaproteobacteria bacterium]|nr:hypothetical protein [Gammaproteobacteria bacterium]